MAFDEGLYDFAMAFDSQFRRCVQYFYSPISISEGSKVRRSHHVAREMEDRTNTANILSIQYWEKM